MPDDDDGDDKDDDADDKDGNGHQDDGDYDKISNVKIEKRRRWRWHQQCVDSLPTPASTLFSSLSKATAVQVHW